MRKAEALGLKWSDFDEKAGKITVHRQLMRKTGIGQVLEETKTAHSQRDIDLGSRIIATLCQHRDRQRFERDRSHLWEDRTEFQNLIFCTPQGKPLDLATTWATFQQVLKDAGLPKMKLHALRDTAATSMLLNGENAKVVAERLGHSDVALTLRVYSHVTAGMHRDAAERLDDLYASAGTDF
jgi:integrase